MQSLPGGQLTTGLTLLIPAMSNDYTSKCSGPYSTGLTHPL